MKVAICVPVDLRGTGGVERHVLSMARALRGLGIEAEVFGRGEMEGEYRDLGQLRPEQYDILHTHSGFLNGQLGLIWNRQPRQRHVHTLHAISLDYLLACGAWWNWRCYWCTLTEAWWSHYADAVIAISGAVSRWARRCFLVNDEKMRVIGNGYWPTEAAPEARAGQRQAARQQRQAKNGDVVVLFVGRGEDRVKGAEAVKTSVGLLREELGNVKLWAAPGSGFEDQAWAVRTGSLPHEGMGALYAGADIFVNASLSEGMPLTVVEAMAAGLAVAAAPVGGIPEVVEDGISGLLLRRDRGDLTAQLRRLATDAALRDRLGKAAVRRAAGFSWEKLARRTADLYEEVLHRNQIGR